MVQVAQKDQAQIVDRYSGAITQTQRYYVHRIDIKEEKAQNSTSRNIILGDV